MSTAIEQISAYYAAFNRGDSDAMIAMLAEDVVHDVNQGTRRTGKAAFTEFCAHMTRCYREELTDIEIMANAQGNRVAAEFIVNGTYLADDQDLPPANGQSYRLPAGAFFELQNDKITRITVYYNLADWMQQVTAS